ncbi:MAG: polyprenol monophosphomannose synthase [Thermodesulfovibrio sp.]|nr:polyprenol monophosphomannose synthase [Thermodesulfovibrio sp.]MCX7724730.1 polyprenol monophosphomannose synthase [Thermodesulfovibrio sp.]
MMDTLVILPTYNEAENIDKLIPKLLKQEVDILFIDDASKDNTAQLIKQWMNKSNRINLIERPTKLGLGTAYITGFKWALNRDYQYIFEMDADLSHDPKDIPKFIKKLEEGYDLVIGSRYTRGTISVVGWDFKRLLLSKFANYYAKTILGLRFLTDLTSGYRCYLRAVLESIELDSIKSNGYAFQIEMVYRAYKKGFKITEIPIIFYERNSGSSKMDKKIVKEAALIVWKLRFGK